MNIKLRPLFFKIGLFSLMAASICFALMITGIAGSNTTAVAYILGILFIISCCSLSLNTTSSILDAPKERVKPFYKKVALAIAIMTAILAILWIIVLFAGKVNEALRYTVGKRFEYGANKAMTQEEAYKAVTDMKNLQQPRLILIQLTIAFTIIVAFINLVVTNKFALKNRMKSVQFILYLSSFIFFAWLLIFIMTYSYEIIPHTDKSYYRLFLHSSVSTFGSAISAFVLISSFMVYMIMKIASARSVRRYRNQILYDSADEDDALDSKQEKKEEIKEAPKQVETTSNNDVKARIEKLNELHQQGLITDEEYEKKKKDIIDSL